MVKGHNIHGALWIRGSIRGRLGVGVLHCSEACKFIPADGTHDLQTKDNYRYVHRSEVPLHMPIALTTASSDI